MKIPGFELTDTEIRHVETGATLMLGPPDCCDRMLVDAIRAMPEHAALTDLQLRWLRRAAEAESVGEARALVLCVLEQLGTEEDLLEPSKPYSRGLLG